MKSRKELRGAILRMHEFGDTERKIAEALRISQSTVHDAISRGTIEDKKGRGRKKTARSKKNIQRVKGMIKRNPSTKANSSRKLAKKLGVGKTQAHQMLRKDLGLKPYKLQKRQKLNANARLKRLQRALALNRRFPRGRHRQIVFSDEKIFDIQQAYNPQNDRIWAEEAPGTEERVVERTQKAKSVMVWAAISARGKTPLVFVDQGTKIDRRVYMEMLESHLIPWAHTIFGDDEWTFQQDGAPAHKARETQDFLRDNCPDVITVDTHWRTANGEWPPNSPDLNPMDYAVWSILEEKACQKPHPNVGSLKRALVKAWDEISLETLQKIVDNFPKRLKACVDAKGGYFE